MILVLDASAAAELLLGTSRGLAVAEAVGEKHLMAPDLLIPEVLSVLRGWTLGGHLTAEQAELALDDLGDLGVELLPMTSLAAAAWALRDNVSAYDAFYVALAQAFRCPLLTCDRRLARAMPDHVRVVGA